MLSETTEQYLDLIKNNTLRNLIKTKNISLAIPLEQARGLKPEQITQVTTNRVKALNAALYVMYTMPEFEPLLINLGVNLSNEELRSVCTENAISSQMRLSELQISQRVHVFCTMYDILRKTAASNGLGSDFTNEHLDDTMSDDTKYSIIKEKLKESVARSLNKPNQSRCIDAWHLMHKIVQGKLTLEELATRIYTINHSTIKTGSAFAKTFKKFGLAVIGSLTPEEELAHITQKISRDLNVRLKSSIDVDQHLASTTLLDHKPSSEATSIPVGAGAAIATMESLVVGNGRESTTRKAVIISETEHSATL